MTTLITVLMGHTLVQTAGDGASLLVIGLYQFDTSYVYDIERCDSPSVLTLDHFKIVSSTRKEMIRKSQQCYQNCCQ